MLLEFKLRYIGQDGSMGLKHGKIYKVKIVSDDRYIWVKWGYGWNMCCPYTSLQSLVANWA